MNRKDHVIRETAMRFVEIVDERGKRIHVGCIMAAGQDWVEVSAPGHLDLSSTGEVRLVPSLPPHAVTIGWRTMDRIGLAYVNDGPPSSWLAGLSGLSTSRSAAEMRSHTPTWLGLPP